MQAKQAQEEAQQQFRQDLIVQLDSAIVVVRELVSQLNEREKAYMHNNSVAYRRLVDTIADWVKSK